MRINRLEELRKVHSDMKKIAVIESAAELLGKEAMLLETMKEIIELSKIARLEGLLALEEAVENIVADSPKEELKQLITLLVDGTDPDVLNGIGMARYYSNLYTDYQALKYLMYLEGALSIQAGDNPRILEEKLKVMLPPNMYLNYVKEQEQRQIQEEKRKEENLIENLCKGERLWNPGENGYYVSRLVDYVICDITDKELQRVMREIDNVDLALAMKGMSGKARRHIFDNLSERLGKLIAEGMVHMGPVRVVDILETSQKILNVLIRLIDRGEIVGKYEYLEPFYQVVHVDTKTVQQKDSKLNQLKRMVEEYEKGAELVREFTEYAQQG